MDTWSETTLGEVMRLQRGHDLPSETRTIGDVPVMGSFGITGWHNEVKAKGPGVTVGRSGASIGVIAYINQDYWPLNTCMYVTDFLGNDPKFCYYWLKTLQLARFNSGSAQPSLNRNYIYGMPVRIPEADEQIEIASILGALDDKIELNRRMNATLEAMAQAVFKEWFVDGAKEEWEEVTIGDLAEFNSWTLGKNDELDVIDYVEISEVNRGDIGLIKQYVRGAEPGRAKRRLRHGDTVMSTVRPDRGAYFLCLDPTESLIASSGFAVITPTKVLWSFIHAALTQPEVFDYLGQQADGGAYPAVRPDIIAAYSVRWPDDQKVLDAFHEIAAPLYERAEHNRNESRTLAELRDTLLPKLMRGEVRVKSTELTTQIT